MGFVMVGKQDFALESQVLPDVLLDPELLLDPERYGFEKRAQAAGAVLRIGLKETLELDERLFVEDDEVQVRYPALSHLQAFVDCPRRKVVIVLDAAEAFLLQSGHDSPFFQETGGAVVVKS